MHIVVLFLGNAVLFAQMPPWAATHNHPRYPAAEFILGVGRGTGEKADESAKRFAQSDIAAQLRIKVKAEAGYIQQTYQLNQNQETLVDFKIKLTSVVDEELTDAQIVETTHDSSTKTIYTLAALNKEKFAAAMGTELSAGWNQAEKLHGTAEDMLIEGKLDDAIRNLLDARVFVMNLLPKQVLHDAVAKVKFAGQYSVRPMGLTADIRNALSRVKIEKKSGDNQKGKIGEKFSVPFVVRVTVAGNENPVPVFGAAVVFLSTSGETLGKVFTDANGIASFSAEAQGNIGAHVRAQLTLQSADREFSSNLISSAVVFNCFLLDADVAFGLKVELSSGALNDVIHSVVAEAVIRTGYRIVDMSRFVLMVRFQTASRAMIDSTEGTLSSAFSEMTIVLIDKGSSNALGAISLKSRGVAKTRDEAIERSVRATKIDEEELVALLEKAKN